jgi:hypothetical protein
VTAPHDYDDLHHLVDRLSPHQAERLRVLAAPRSRVCPRRAARSSRKAAGQRRLPVIGIWEPGRGDLPEQHDEIIRGRLKHPARHCSPALAARQGHRPLRQPPRPLRCPAAIRRRLSASPTTVIAEMCWLPEQRPGNEPAFLTLGHHRGVRARQHRRCRPAAHGRTRARLCRSATRRGRRPVIAAAKRLKLTGAATLDLRHFTVVHPPHTAALNLLPQTPTAQPARHLTEQPVTLRHRTSTRLAPRTAITYACCCPVPGPRRHADHGDPHRRARGRYDRPHPNLPVL